MTGFIITKYHELIRFFIKNLTRMSLKLEKPEKIRISFKCYFFLLFGIFRIPTACSWLPICQNIIISHISRPFHVFHQLERHFLLHTAPLIPPYYSVFPLWAHFFSKGKTPQTTIYTSEGGGPPRPPSSMPTSDCLDIT